jgi:hypothetical protein
MRKLLLSFFCFMFLFAVTEVNAQSNTASSGTTKDEYWGTAKTSKGGADQVGRRSANLDKRLNEYESGKKSRFDKRLTTNSKRAQAILKKEEKMMKKHKRDKRMLERKRNKKKFLFF